MNYLKILFLLNIIALVLMVFGAVFFEEASTDIAASESSIDYDIVLKEVEESNDISWVKQGAIISIQAKKEITSNLAAMYKEVSGSLLILVLFHITNIFLLYKSYTQLISNKLNQTRIKRHVR